MSRTRYIIANWKMNTTIEQALELAELTSTAMHQWPDVDIAIAPPATWIVPLQDAFDLTLNIYLQDVSTEQHGAYTGEISMSMVAEECIGALVGHSERRARYNETDQLVNQKFHAVFDQDRRPVLCVGENLDQRQTGNAESVVLGQLDAGLQGIESNDGLGFMVAYEPVWAIGTGVSASTSDASTMADAIRGWLDEHIESPETTIPILYGGSVNPANTLELLLEPNIDGVLVGSASLNPASYHAICAAAAEAMTTN